MDFCWDGLMQKCLIPKCRFSHTDTKHGALTFALWIQKSTHVQDQPSHPPLQTRHKGFDRHATDGSWWFLFLAANLPVRMESRRSFSIYSPPSVSHLFCLEQERLKCFTSIISQERSPSKAGLIRQIEVESPHIQINRKTFAFAFK